MPGTRESDLHMNDPFSWAPSTSCLAAIDCALRDGADGDWSSFNLHIGSPEQGVRVLPSTAGFEIWVVAPGGCLPDEAGKVASETCAESRGELFNPENSTSWVDNGIYTMDLEKNLGMNDTAKYGFDGAALGVSEDLGGPQIEDQVVAAYANNDYYVGMFGLSPQPSNFTNLTNPHPTFLTSLRSRNLILSLSWGYTAGARYQSKDGAFGSLTLGGYDSSRIVPNVPNNISFSLHPDPSRDLVVSLQSITLASLNGSATSLLSEPIWTFIDSTTPYIYLPYQACHEFEKPFGLVWNDTYQIYFVEEKQHSKLLQADCSITFRLAESKTGQPTVDINLPYSSFDLTINYPLVPKNLSGTHYFPLMRASNESQYTLGRTFLQEAYLITNYEQSSFSIYQSRYEEGTKPDIVKIPSKYAPAKSSVSRADIAGISVGALSFLLLCILATVLVLQNRRKARRKCHGQQPAACRESLQHPEPPNTFLTQEIGMNSLIGLYRELPEGERVELANEGSHSAPEEEGPGLVALTVQELNEPSVAPQHEVMDLHDSGDGVLIRNGNMKNEYRILVSTDISRHSWTSNGNSGEIPIVQTTISSRNTARVNLDRSLPPTPISESTQSFPAVVTFNKSVVSGDVSKALCERSMIVASVHGNLARVSSPTPLNAWQRAFAHLSYASMDMEIVVPPGSSESNIIQPLRIHKKDAKRRRNFF